jgi:hypothetical protein
MHIVHKVKCVPEQSFLDPYVPCMTRPLDDKSLSDVL